jgi:hypothetical protein
MFDLHIKSPFHLVIRFLQNGCGQWMLTKKDIWFCGEYKIQSSPIIYKMIIILLGGGVNHISQ